MYQHKKIYLLNNKEKEEYYNYLLRAFKKEYLGVSNRQIIENLSVKSVFAQKEIEFLKSIVGNSFLHKKQYRQISSSAQQIDYPIELINFIVAEGYTPTSTFVHWVYKKLRVRWKAKHWYTILRRDIAPIDADEIKKELKKNPQKIPALLELYYKLGVGLERAPIHPDKGIWKSIDVEFKDIIKYRKFNPIEYLVSYYGELDIELMTLSKVLYDLLLKNRKKLPKHSKVLIVGNGPLSDDAQLLSMIPEIDQIIPADIDPRNNKIMQRHTGNRNPLATQKAKHGEEHSDLVYYLFEKATKIDQGLFPVREITAVKTKDPIFIDISKINPLNLKQNQEKDKKLKPDLVEVPYCPESITSKLSKYKAYLKNISNLVEPGKFLMMAALKNAEYYKIGSQKLPAVPINEKIVHTELEKNGFINIEIITVKATKKKLPRGFTENMIIWAEKK